MNNSINKNSCSKIKNNNNLLISKSKDSKNTKISNDLEIKYSILNKAFKETLEENKKLNEEIEILREKNINLEALFSAAKDEIDEKEDIILELYNILESKNIE